MITIDPNKIKSYEELPKDFIMTIQHIDSINVATMRAVNEIMKTHVVSQRAPSHVDKHKLFPGTTFVFNRKTESTLRREGNG